MRDAHDDAGGARSRWPSGRQLVAALAITASASLSAVYMWGLSDRYTCPEGYGTLPDVSYAWLKLLVGTLGLAAGAAAIVIGHGFLRRMLLWVTLLCSLPAALAWLKLLGLHSGCPS